MNTINKESKVIKNVYKKEIIQEEPVPHIKREIDGVMYTVKIHFNPESSETAKKKIERLLLNDVLNENIQNQVLKNY